ncbi:MAG: DUF3820 family protein [Flavobacteriales bacterium]|nr:DUF3820 family protein [Flavobacteriales bacterium]
MREDQAELLQLVRMKMPFGKYKDRLLSDLPVTYLEWFARKGFPPGKLGDRLSLVHTVKTNGLDHLFVQLKSIARNDGR